MSKNQNQTEKALTGLMSGWVAVGIAIAIGLFATYSIITNWNVVTVIEGYGAHSDGEFNLVGVLIRAVVATVLIFLVMAGTVSLQHNEAIIFTFAGEYKGTLRGPGYFWLPFWWSSFSERTLAVQTVRIEQKTVNDKGGKPIMIGCDIFCHENDTFKATFDVDNLSEYLHSKGEVALRKLAMTHHMDSENNNEVCLRGSVEQIITDLQNEISIEFAKVGYTVEKAAITTLQYTPEVAGQMLQRQNAEATIAARKTIAEGAAGIVKDTIETLKKEQKTKFSSEGRERLITNLVVVLCSHNATVPVVPLS